MKGFLFRGISSFLIKESCTAKNCSTSVLSVTNSQGYANTNTNFRNLSSTLEKSTQESLQPRKMRIGVQGACLDRGQTKRGAAEGPKVIRSSGVVGKLREIGHDVHDYGDLTLNLFPKAENESALYHHPKLKNLKQVADANKLISTTTSNIVKDGRICLTLGGDHSIGIGTINGVSQIHDDLAVLWVDAHCDINTVDTTQSGNMHGMPLAFLIKELQPYMEQIPAFSWVTPRIKANNIAYIGLRDVEAGEKAILEKLGITAFSMKDVDNLGIIQVTKMALEQICPGNKRPLHVSFDIDSLDDLEVANTGTPVPGGLSFREGLTLLEIIYQAANMVSMDLVEINPLLGGVYQEKRTSVIARQLLLTLFGYNRGGVANGARLKFSKRS